MFYELVFDVRVQEAGKSMCLAVPLVIGLAPVFLPRQPMYSGSRLLAGSASAPAPGLAPMVFSESTYATGTIGSAASASVAARPQ